MIAYSEKELYNNYVLAQARQGFKVSQISAESLQKIEKAYPSKLYTPNVFIGIALGLLTLLAFSFIAFLFGLLASSDIDSGIIVTGVFMTLVSYITLELLVKNKMYFNAGVDNALMILVLLFTSAIFIASSENPSWILTYALLMIMSLWLCIRFTDALMALVSGSFFLLICYLLFLKPGGTTILYFPPGMMLLLGGLYFVIHKRKSTVRFIYEKCITAFRVFLLMAFYAVGNYWVISELQRTEMNQPAALSYGGLFWIFTFLIPVLYILYGVAKKDILFIRTGMFLVLLTFLTYKYYFAFLPLEVEMLILGLILVAMGYFFIRRLRPGRYGFTSESISPPPAWKNIEALVIAETLGEVKVVQEDTLMSGGSSGGGGASGDF